jgi:hypothetical protein
MTEELLKKLNTTGAFDTPWLKEQLRNWDVVEEQKKAHFMERLYQVYQPTNKCYTGLWERFCLTEAGSTMRERYFEMLAAVKEYEELVAKQKELEVAA